MKNILFLCTQNSCRSQMAEGLTNTLLRGEVKAFSAGTDPHPVHPLAVKAMWEKGIDISRAYSKHVNEFLDKEFDLVITLCGSAKDNCPSWPGQLKNMHFGLEDPAKAQGTEEERLEAFRQTRQQIIKELIPALKRELGL